MATTYIGHANLICPTKTFCHLVVVLCPCRGCCDLCLDDRDLCHCHDLYLYHRDLSDHGLCRLYKTEGVDLEIFVKILIRLLSVVYF
jgi:hypothetical protein